MSQISLISNQYNSMVAKSDQVNNSVIAYKKKSLLQDQSTRQQYPKLSVTNEELDAAREILLTFLQNVLSLLRDEQAHYDFFPSLIVSDYRQKLLSNVYLEEEIDEMITRLQNREAIDESSILVLDNLLSTFDKERNALFRKLRRARG